VTPLCMLLSLLSKTRLWWQILAIAKHSILLHQGRLWNSTFNKLSLIIEGAADKLSLFHC
jgi:hypothetical protein